MLLSDKESTQFYNEYDELKNEIKALEEYVHESRMGMVNSIREKILKRLAGCNKHLDKIHKIIYENLE